MDLDICVIVNYIANKMGYLTFVGSVNWGTFLPVFAKYKRFGRWYSWIYLTGGILVPVTEILQKVSWKETKLLSCLCIAHIIIWYYFYKAHKHTILLFSWKHWFLEDLNKILSQIFRQNMLFAYLLCFW